MKNSPNNLKLLIEILESSQGWDKQYRQFEERLAKFLMTSNNWGELERWLKTTKPETFRRTMMLLEQLMHQGLGPYSVIFEIISQGRNQLAILVPEPGPIDYQQRWGCDLELIDCHNLKNRMQELGWQEA